MVVWLCGGAVCLLRAATRRQADRVGGRRQRNRVFETVSCLRLFFIFRQKALKEQLKTEPVWRMWRIAKGPDVARALNPAW